MEILCTCCYLILAGFIYGAYKYIPKIILQRKLDRFEKSKCPKDIVILHGTRRTVTVPTPSPFVFKLETFLRMAKIPYEYDGNIKNTMGPKGKTPWITLNGEHVADSQLCIEFLSKKFNKSVSNKYSEKELATANCVRVTLEDRMFWELVMWVFVWDGEGQNAVKAIGSIPSILLKYVRYKYGKSTMAQGIARHDKEVVMEWTFKNLKAISAILGNNKFLLGDEPCTEDAALFGFTAQFLWGFAATSPYAKLLEGECLNLKEYCYRMKELYYPDWDQCLRK